MSTTAWTDQFAPDPEQPPSGQSAALPERDPGRPAKHQGLFRKFDVRRVDGSDAPGGRHDGCRYFVLDVDHDAYATAALTAYAAACEATHPDLARDLRERWGAQPAAATVSADAVLRDAIAHGVGAYVEIDGRQIHIPAEVLRGEQPAAATPMDAEVWAELHTLRAERGPADGGYATWKDAAVAERKRRVELERTVAATVPARDAALEEAAAKIDAMKVGTPIDLVVTAFASEIRALKGSSHGE